MVACLRNKTAAEIQDVNYNVPFPGAAAPPLYMYNPVVDGDLLRDLTYAAYEQGEFIRVPVIVGDDTNGGTVFVPSNTSTLAQSNMFLRNQFPYVTLADFATINALYPNPNDTCPNEGCYWRQASNVYGEMRYMCPGLRISSAFADASSNANVSNASNASSSSASGTSTSWAYRWDVEDPADVAAGLGVQHTVELNAVFGPENTNGEAPASYYPGEINAHAVAVAQGYWTSFIRTLDPNVHRLPGSAEWRPWDDATKGRLLFSTGGETGMEELVGTGIEARCEFWYGIGVDIRQ